MQRVDQTRLLDDENTIRVRRCSGKVLGGSTLLLAAAGLTLALGGFGDGDCDGPDEKIIQGIGATLLFIGGTLGKTIWDHVSANRSFSFFCCRKAPTQGEEPAKTVALTVAP